MDQITPLAVRERLSFRLRKLIGPGGRMTLAEAAKATDISEATLKAYVEGRACPNLARYGRLLRVFGPEVGMELAMMIGWEPRASNSRLPVTEDLRAVRDVTGQAIGAIDRALSHGVSLSDPSPAPDAARPASGRAGAAARPVRS